LPSTATARRGGQGAGGDGLRWRLLGGQPGADGTVEGVGVDAGQHPAHGRLAGWLPGAGPRVAAHPKRGQDLAGRVAGPLTDGGQRPRAGQHRADRDAEHADQWMPSATPVAGVGDLSEVAEQVTALVGGQHTGAEPADGQPQQWEMMSRQARRSGLVMDWDTHMIAESRACSTSTRPIHLTITN
jgi:hypothetical protein